MSEVSIRAAVIKEVQSGLAGITVANGFQTNVKKVLRGIRSREDFETIPGLAIWNESRPTQARTFSGNTGTLILHIFGIVEVDARNDKYDNLDKLLADVEKCVTTVARNSYADKTEVRDLTIYEGGSEDSFGEFDMVIEVQYDYERDTP